MESIVKFFSRYYNFVKTFKKYYKDSEKVEIFDKIFEKYKDQIQTFLKKYNLEERFIQAIDNDAPADIIFIFVELIINALRDNDLRKFLLEMWITSVRHFEELIPNLVIPILDPDVYYEIKSLIEEAASVDAESVIKVLWSYFRIISEKPTILDINSSLLVNKEKNPEELWIFFIIYQVDVVSLSKDKVLELPFPFIKNGDVKWLKLGDIKEIKLISYQGNWTYQIENGYILKPTKKIISWLNFLELNFLCYIITKFIKIDFNKTDQFPEVSLNLETLPTNEYKPEYGRFYVVPFNKNSILNL